MIVAPIAAMLIQMAISRTREFVADETAARITSQPSSLGSALRKIEHWAQKVPMHQSNPATAHLFIINPLHGGECRSCSAPIRQPPSAWRDWKP
jgi:heat shock protein HtpX